MPSTPTEPRILSVIIKREWFDQIADGTKTEEYRDFTQHWCSRLLTSDYQYREFDVVEFINGYNKDAPRLLVEWRETIAALYDDAPDGSTDPDDSYFIIRLGKVITRVNC